MQRSDAVSQDSRIKRGKDEDRFYCPYPGCTRSFAELWRLKVHYRAPPDVRGSGKERGHGTELQHCPKCGKELKPGKHHVGCCAGRSGQRQAVKRSRDSAVEADAVGTPAGDIGAESSRQRTRTDFPEVKFEDVLPRATSLNAFSEEAAILTGRDWRSGPIENFHALQRSPDERLAQQQRHPDLSNLDFDLPANNAADSFAKFQSSLAPLRPGQARLGMPSAPSPPPNPPPGASDFGGMQQPLFNFALFNPERARGKHARLPVAVTSTLHADPAPDDLVLQALLGDAQSYAASGTQQLPVNDDQRQQVQSALAHQRIQQLAASAQERLRVQGPSLPSQPVAQFPTRYLQQRNSAESAHSLQSPHSLGGPLLSPMPFVDTIEHYEPLGSGRPSRASAQQGSQYQAPSNNWVHRQVNPRPADYRPGGLTRLTPFIQSDPRDPRDTQQQQQQQQQPPEPQNDLHAMLPWDASRWGGLPVDLEQSIRQRQQQHQNQQLQQQQQPQQLRAPPNSSTSIDMSQLEPSPMFGVQYPHLQTREQPAYPSSLSQALDTARGYQLPPSAFDLQFQYHQEAQRRPASAEAFGFPEPFSVFDSENEALQAYGRRLQQQQQMQHQGQLPQQARSNYFPWSNQALLFPDDADRAEAPDGAQHLGISRSLPPMAFMPAGESGQNTLAVQAAQGPRAPSPDALPASMSKWFSPNGRDLLEQLGNYSRQSPFEQLQFQSPLQAANAEGNLLPSVAQQPDHGGPPATKS